MTYQPVPPRPGDNRRTLRIVLIVVGVVLVVCCAGGATGGWLLWRTVDDAVGPARDATTTYLEAVEAGDHRRAYEQLCRQKRALTTPEQFARQREGLPRLVDHDITGVNVSNRNGTVLGTATVRLTTDGGVEMTQVISLVKEDGSWRVCS